MLRPSWYSLGRKFHGVLFTLISDASLDGGAWYCGPWGTWGLFFSRVYCRVLWLFLGWSLGWRSCSERGYRTFDFTTKLPKHSWRVFSALWNQTTICVEWLNGTSFFPQAFRRSSTLGITCVMLCYKKLKIWFCRKPSTSVKQNPTY